ncbi:DNA polymerase III subunit delta [soil metagenome]
MSQSTNAPVYLVRGDDESLLRDEVVRLVDELVGDGDRGLMVEELAGADYELATLVDAAQTPPFLSDRRIVVGRGVERFATVETVAPLVAYLVDPLPTTTMVLVWERGRVPKPLLDALKSAGGAQVDTSTGRDQKGWLARHVADSGLRLDAEASELVAATLGEDVARLRGLLETLAATYGPTARLTSADVAPYLGEAGALAPWALTAAIDGGEIPVALDRLQRMLGAGERHPLQVMSTLHSHFARMLTVDGADVRGESDAAALLGLKGSTFPARKALSQARRLGHDRIARAVELLAQADLDLRGAKAWPEELVMEVLVARLASLSRR